jgi:FKBP-type peptidyl-prolyl cis-trans isomerase
VGTGAEAANGRRLTVHYTLWLYDPVRPESKGQQLQTSVGGSPFSFVLGAGAVIRGWDQGVPGMKTGGTRRLVVPPSLAYGSSGQGSIPPNATLVFDIQLLEVQ